jgi:lipopolysaccharide/colanic/teichoic acid biosynthesis glycosyltransferase
VADLLLLEARSSDPGLATDATKWLVDRLAATVLVVLTAPLFLVLAVMVRLDSRGPALFRQTRIGRDGRRFRIMKLRTMVVDAEERLHRDGLYDLYVESGFKLPPDIDPRTTRLGRFLRRTSLDELPQLLNVAKGEMSLVGPRPVVPDELTLYEDLQPVYLALKPGITGYWQVNGRSDIGFPERAELDAYYFNNRSLRLDLLILSRTVLAVLRREGAH